MVDLEKVRRILIIKLRYIGDVLLTTPVIRALRAGFTHAHLAALVNAGTEEVLVGNPDLNEILCIQKTGWFEALRFIRQLRNRYFDLVIDLTDGDRSALLSFFSRAPIRVGYNHEQRWRGRLYTHLVKADREKTHQILYHLESVRTLGLPVNEAQPRVCILEKEREDARTMIRQLGLDLLAPLVMIHPGARWPLKSWPIERFAQLADFIQDRMGARVVLFGGILDRYPVEAIQNQMRTRAVALVGQLTLRQLAAFIQQCTLFISNDNGPMHLAAALNRPVIALFGFTDPTVWGPWGKGHQVFYKPQDCRSCWPARSCVKGYSGCMSQISVEEVVKAVEEKIGACR